MSKRATASVTHSWSNGESTTFIATLPASFPDVLDEVRSQATRMFQDGLAYIQALEQTSDADEAG